MRLMRKTLFFLIIIVAIFVAFLFVQINNEVVISDNLLQELEEDTPNYVTYDKIPKDLINAVISAEDKRFKEHNGIDIFGMGRAFIINLKNSEIKQGASTITQQLAKNLYLTHERTYTRKIKEIFLALKLEEKYSKEEILEMYLNIIYLGYEATGIQEGSLKYFDKDVSELNTDECAMLAGIIRSPGRFNPLTNPENAKAVQQHVLEQMTENGYLSDKQLN